MFRSSDRFLRDKIATILSRAGITLDGARPFDIQIRDNRFYREVIRRGSLGLGESYMDGWWDCQALDQFFHRLFTAGLHTTVRPPYELWHAFRARVWNRQTCRLASCNVRHHYDIDRELYRHMLDKRMIYSCAFWQDADTLDQAQEVKLRLTMDKLQLQPGMRLLDIGCGWGGAARYAAEHYKVKVVGITVSQDQAEYAREHCRGLDVAIRLQDYRALDQSFDRILSIGMFEHVGVHNYRTFMKTIHRLLAEDGLFLLHTIGSNRSVYAIDPWMDRYIFPNAVLPSTAQISAAFEDLFILEDWHAFGQDYDPTLMAWHDNFHKNRHLIPLAKDERFTRMWSYYLLACAGSFRARKNQVWQLLLSKKGLPGGYRPDRHKGENYAA